MPVITSDVALLTAGLNGAVVLSVYSTSLAESGFLLPRTVDATAVIFVEPDIEIPRTSISRQSPGSDSHSDPSCNRPIINLAPKLNTVIRHPLIIKVKKGVENIEKRVSNIQEKMATAKMTIIDKLRIGCLFPRMIRPFEPIFKYVRCKLGLDEDQFMEAAKCNAMKCNASLEEKTISHDIGPAPMKMMNLGVQTMADCFGEMKQMKYGARVLAKIVNDEPCDDPKYQAVCKEVIDEGRIVREERCTTPE